MSYKVVTIGGSAGALASFTKILTSLPENFETPIVIVQHLLEQSDSYLAEHLDKISSLTVSEALDKERIHFGHAYTSPPGYHILIENETTISLSTDVPVKYSRPSIDLLFESAADVFGVNTIGVLLTGANDDGAEGLHKIKRMGGITIVEDPKGAFSPTMPESAIEMFDVDYVLPAEKIGGLLANLCEVSDGK